MLTFFLVCGACSLLKADSSQWEFNPPKVGAAILGGGWSIQRSLGEINGSPEFDFPLQLVYESTHEGNGLFGGQWFCPQLESTALPKGPGVLVWTQPNGGLVALFANRHRPTEFADRTGKWFAHVIKPLVTIYNKEGWQYRYRSGKPLAIISPSRRELDFIYNGTTFSGLVLRDARTGGRRSLVSATQVPNGHVVKINVCGLKSTLSYGKNGRGNLLAFQRADRPHPDTFSYTKEKVLATFQPSLGKKVIFHTRFHAPKHENANLARRDPANYDLTSDGTLTYHSGSDSVTVTDAQGHKLTKSYAMARGIETDKDSHGNEIKRYYYMAPGLRYNGKLRRLEKNGEILVENYYEHNTGNLIQSRGKDGISTYYQYLTAPRGHQDDLRYQKPIRIWRGAIRRSAKLVTTIQYDAQGHPVSVTDEKTKQTTRYIYDSRGELTTIIPPVGKKQSIVYDDFGRVKAVLHGAGKSGTGQHVAYDANGHVQSTTAPDGQQTHYAYDANGHLLKVKQNNVVTATYKRNIEGEPLAKTDALGHVTKYDYDALARLVAIHQPNGVTTRCEYNAKGQKIAQIDGDGHHIDFVYDANGHLISQKDPLGEALTWDYDADGHLLTRSNGVSQTGFTYDANDHLASVDYGHGEIVTNQYDAKGRLKKAIAGSNSVTYFYDDQNRIAAREYQRGAVDQVIRYGFDKNGHRNALAISARTITKKNPKPSYHLLQQTNYHFNDDGNLVQLKSNGRVVCDYAYDKVGHLIQRTYGDGIIAKYRYDKFGHETRMTLSGGPLEKPLVLAYQWDTAGNLIARSWNGKIEHFSYDPAGQLLAVTGIAPSHSKSAPAPQTASNAAEKAAGKTKATSASAQSANSKKSAKTASAKTAKPAKSANGDLHYASNKTGGKAESTTKTKSVSHAASTTAAADSQTKSNESIESVSAALHQTYRYDAAGNMIEKIINGKKTAMTYNAANELTQKTAIANSEAKAKANSEVKADAKIQTKLSAKNDTKIDAKTSVKGSIKASGKTSIAKTNSKQKTEQADHPNSAKPTNSTDRTNPANREVVTQFTYDKAGRLIQTNSDGQITRRAYGFLNKVIHITKPDGTQVGFDYFPDGQLAVDGPLPDDALITISSSGKRSPIAHQRPNRRRQAAAQTSQKKEATPNYFGVRDPNAAQTASSSSKKTANPARAGPSQKNSNQTNTASSQPNHSSQANSPQPGPNQTWDFSKIKVRNSYLWDGLALLVHNGVAYAIEPHPSGGIPVAASQDPKGPLTYYVNDILGTTLAVIHPGHVQILPMSTFAPPLKRKTASKFPGRVRVSRAVSGVHAGNLQTKTTNLKTSHEK